MNLLMELPIDENLELEDTRNSDLPLERIVPWRDQ